MFSTNLKRSVATLGVVAGLLAAAGPASAQGGGADFPRGPQDPAFRFEMAGLPVKAPAKTWTEGNNQPSGGGCCRGATLGTQVGSEGVIDDVPTETVSFIKGAAFRGEVTGLEPY